MLKKLSMEATRLLEDKPVIASTLNILRRMNPALQLEAAQLMLATENYSQSFAKALLVATDPAELLTPRIRSIPGLSSATKGDMKQEMQFLRGAFKTVENYGADVLSFVVASTYISKLIENQAIESYLRRNHPNILREFQTIVGAKSLEDTSREFR